jgi:hypothetical protein
VPTCAVNSSSYQRLRRCSSSAPPSTASTSPGAHLARSGRQAVHVTSLGTAKPHAPGAGWQAVAVALTYDTAHELAQLAGLVLSEPTSTPP